MKKIILSILPIIVVALVALAGGMALTPTAHATQTLLWSDEFSGTSVDTTKWIVYNQADGSDSWYAPKNVTVSGGLLLIANLEESFNGKHWTGGGMESATQFPQYCYLEAKVRFSTQGSFDWGTWWTVG